MSFRDHYKVCEVLLHKREKRRKKEAAMRFQLPSLAVLLLTLWCVANAGSMQGKTYLLADTGYRVTTYQARVHARSKIDCIRTCRRFFNCTSFVFEKSSGDCYLNPNITSGGDGSVHLYADAVSACNPESMPSFKNGSVDVWRQTLTTLEGNVTCDGDFMETLESEKVKVQCTPNGTWKTNGECLQYIFRNPPLQSFKIPRPVKEGWSVCIEGTPTARIRFTVDLVVDTSNWCLHSDYRFSYFMETNVTILNKCVANTFGTRKVVGYLPLLVNQPFRLQIALKTNDTFELTINGQFYANFTSSNPPPLQVASVNVYNNVSLQLVNVWCSP